MIDRRRVLMLGGGLAATLLPGRVEAADPAGHVQSLHGKASAQASAAERMLATGDAVEVSDLVQTAANSRLGLKLGRSTLVNLGPSTRLRIERHLVEAGGAFELVEGQILFEHVRERAAAPATTEIRSPYGLIAVRGTQFFAGRSRGQFGVFVLDGQVDVTAAGRSVRLVPGYGTNVREPGAAPTPAAVWPPARIRDALLATTGKVAPSR